MQQHRPYRHMKMARYSFSETIPAKFEHKLVRRHKQIFGKIATTVVLDSSNISPWESITGAFSSNSRLDVREVKTESVRALSRYFGIKFLSLEIR